MDAVSLDPIAMLFSPGGADEPQHAYRQLRDQCPVARNEFAGRPGEQPLIPLQVDPPEHTRYRRLLNPKFLPRTVARIEPDVRVLVGQPNVRTACAPRRRGSRCE